MARRQRSDQKIAKAMAAIAVALTLVLLMFT